METGCIIDGSHMSVNDFDTAIIEFAIEQGYNEIDVDLFRKDNARYSKYLAAEDRSVYSADEEYEFIEIEYQKFWLLTSVENFLDSIAPDGYAYVIEDQSLFLEESDD